MPDPSEFQTTERAGLVVWLLAAGRTPTTNEVAELAGISRCGAWNMMNRLSRVLPLYQERVGRRLEWHVLPPN